MSKSNFIMSPKPVRIGLRKKPASASEDFSDEGDELLSQAVSVDDPDETLPPLTTSAVKQLKKMVDMDVSDSAPDSAEDIFADEVENRQ